MTSKIFPAIVVLFFSCRDNSQPVFEKNNAAPPANSESSVNLYLRVSDIPLPDGFSRLTAEKNSFNKWLRDLTLKKDKTVYLYNGSKKKNQTAQFAVIDISVGKQDLQQCADAVMRLRAEYLFSRQLFESIRFEDNNGTAYQLNAPFTREHFDRYLPTVFGMCGSASLSKQLVPVSNRKEIIAGDVLIRGGFPGHAVIVMDMAQNAAGEKIFLLAQSYMPAQDIHVLINPMDKTLSPWYQANDENMIATPEYIFYKNELKRWREQY